MVITSSERSVPPSLRLSRELYQQQWAAKEMRDCLLIVGGSGETQEMCDDFLKHQIISSWSIIHDFDERSAAFEMKMKREKH